MSVLTALPAAAATHIHQVLPELRVCRPFAGRFDLRELKAMSTQSPAVFVSCLACRQTRGFSGPADVFDAHMAAFVVTRDALGVQRDELAAAIGHALLATVPGRRWGLAECGEATTVEYRQLDTRETREAATAMSVVAWVQPLTLAADDASAPMSLTVLLGQAPEIGPEHVDDYREIGVAS